MNDFLEIALMLDTYLEAACTFAITQAEKVTNYRFKLSLERIMYKEYDMLISLYNRLKMLKDVKSSVDNKYNWRIISFTQTHDNLCEVELRKEKIYDED